MHTSPPMLSARCTKVIDDESDYFSVDGNSWRSTDEREALQKKEDDLRGQVYASRRNKAVTLDIAGRRVVKIGSDIGKLISLKVLSSCSLSLVEFKSTQLNVDGMDSFGQMTKKLRSVFYSL